MNNKKHEVPDTDLAKHYYSKGYAVAKSVFSTREVNDLRSAVLNVMDTWGPQEVEGWKGEWRKDFVEEGVKTKLGIMQEPFRYDYTCMASVFQAKLLDRVEEILGPQFDFFSQSIHIKYEETGAPFPMHQDNPYYAFADERAVISMVHLDDTDDVNGALHVFPESHLQGPLPHEQGDAGKYLPPDKWRLKDATPIYCKSGDVLFFGVNLIHGSPLNRSKHARVALCNRYRHPENSVTNGIEGMCLMARGTRPNPNGQRVGAGRSKTYGNVAL